MTSPYSQLHIVASWLSISYLIQREIIPIQALSVLYSLILVKNSLMFISKIRFFNYKNSLLAEETTLNQTQIFNFNYFTLYESSHWTDWLLVLSQLSNDLTGYIEIEFLLSFILYLFQYSSLFSSYIFMFLVVLSTVLIVYIVLEFVVFLYFSFSTLPFSRKYSESFMSKNEFFYYLLNLLCISLNVVCNNVFLYSTDLNTRNISMISIKSMNILYFYVVLLGFIVVLLLSIGIFQYFNLQMTNDIQRKYFRIFKITNYLLISSYSLVFQLLIIRKSLESNASHEFPLQQENSVFFSLVLLLSSVIISLSSCYLYSHLRYKNLTQPKRQTLNNISILKPSLIDYIRRIIFHFSNISNENSLIILLSDFENHRFNCENALCPCGITVEIDEKASNSQKELVKQKKIKEMSQEELRKVYFPFKRLIKYYVFYIKSSIDMVNQGDLLEVYSYIIYLEYLISNSYTKIMFLIYESRRLFHLSRRERIYMTVLERTMSNLLSFSLVKRDYSVGLYNLIVLLLSIDSLEKDIEDTLKVLKDTIENIYYNPKISIFNTFSLIKDFYIKSTNIINNINSQLYHKEKLALNHLTFLYKYTIFNQIIFNSSDDYYSSMSSYIKTLISSKNSLFLFPNNKFIIEVNKKKEFIMKIVPISFSHFFNYRQDELENKSIELLIPSYLHSQHKFNQDSVLNCFSLYSNARFKKIGVDKNGFVKVFFLQGCFVSYDDRLFFLSEVFYDGHPYDEVQQKAVSSYVIINQDYQILSFCQNFQRKFCVFYDILEKEDFKLTVLNLIPEIKTLIEMSNESNCGSCGNEDEEEGNKNKENQLEFMESHRRREEENENQTLKENENEKKIKFDKNVKILRDTKTKQTQKRRESNKSNKNNTKSVKIFNVNNNDKQNEITKLTKLTKGSTEPTSLIKKKEKPFSFLKNENQPVEFTINMKKYIELILSSYKSFSIIIENNRIINKNFNSFLSSNITSQQGQVNVFHKIIYGKISSSQGHILVINNKNLLIKAIYIVEIQVNHEFKEVTSSPSSHFLITNVKQASNQQKSIDLDLDSQFLYQENKNHQSIMSSHAFSNKKNKKNLYFYSITLLFLISILYIIIKAVYMNMIILTIIENFGGIFHIIALQNHHTSLFNTVIIKNIETLYMNKYNYTNDTGLLDFKQKIDEIKAHNLLIKDELQEHFEEFMDYFSEFDDYFPDLNIEINTNFTIPTEITANSNYSSMKHDSVDYKIDQIKFISEHLSSLLSLIDIDDSSLSMIFLIKPLKPMNSIENHQFKKRIYDTSYAYSNIIKVNSLYFVLLNHIIKHLLDEYAYYIDLILIFNVVFYFLVVLFVVSVFVLVVKNKNVNFEFKMTINKRLLFYIEALLKIEEAIVKVQSLSYNIDHVEEYILIKPFEVTDEDRILKENIFTNKESENENDEKDEKDENQSQNHSQNPDSNQDFDEKDKEKKEINRKSKRKTTLSVNKMNNSLIDQHIKMKSSKSNKKGLSNITKNENFLKSKSKMTKTSMEIKQTDENGNYISSNQAFIVNERKKLFGRERKKGEIQENNENTKNEETIDYYLNKDILSTKEFYNKIQLSNRNILVKSMLILILLTSISAIFYISISKMTEIKNIFLLYTSFGGTINMPGVVASFILIDSFFPEYHTEEFLFHKYNNTDPYQVHSTLFPLVEFYNLIAEKGSSFNETSAKYDSYIEMYLEIFTYKTNIGLISLDSNFMNVNILNLCTLYHQTKAGYLELERQILGQMLSSNEVCQEETVNNNEFSVNFNVILNYFNKKMKEIHVKYSKIPRNSIERLLEVRIDEMRIFELNNLFPYLFIHINEGSNHHDNEYVKDDFLTKILIFYVVSGMGFLLLYISIVGIYNNSNELMMAVRFFNLCIQNIESRYLVRSDRSDRGDRDD